jgi:hypothetical protein
VKPIEVRREAMQARLQSIEALLPAAERRADLLDAIAAVLGGTDEEARVVLAARVATMSGRSCWALTTTWVARSLSSASAVSARRRCGP